MENELGTDEMKLVVFRLDRSLRAVRSALCAQPRVRLPAFGDVRCRPGDVGLVCRGQVTPEP